MAMSIPLLRQTTTDSEGRFELLTDKAGSDDCESGWSSSSGDR